MYHHHTICRACGNAELVTAADFGVTPLVNALRKPGETQEGYAPLKVMVCPTCSLAQLSVVVDPKILYANYLYAHSTTETFFKHVKWLTDILHEHRPRLGRILEIGSNDGALLAKLKEKPDVDTVLGCDPALNLVTLSDRRHVNAVVGLFGSHVANVMFHAGEQFDVVIARHVFAHMDDWMDVMRGLAMVTHDESIVAIEVQYAEDLLENVEFVNIYHEHLSYVNLRGLAALLARTDFHMHAAYHVDYNTGSIIVILRRNSYPIAPRQSVESLMECEKTTAWTWVDFKRKSDELIANLRERVQTLHGRAMTICGYSAPARATNWIHQCGFTQKEIAFVTDGSPLKQGCHIPGTDIPVVHPSWLREKEPDIAILFATNFEAEILKNEAAYIDAGGVFINPLKLE